MRAVVTIALLLSFTMVAVSARQPVVDYYVQATQARAAEDYDKYVELMGKALELIPGHSILMRHIAQGHALAGRSDKAVENLMAMAGTGAVFDLAEYPEFEPIKNNEKFAAVAELLQKNLSAAGEAKVHVEIAEADLIPEGITFDPTEEAFYLSSVHKRKIVKIDRSGKASDFVSGYDDFFCGLGMKVDNERRQLWVATAAFDGMQGFTEEMNGRSSLMCFDLKSGERARVVAVTGEESNHNFNDLEIDGDGRVFVTDAGNGAIYSLAPGAEEFETLLDEGTLSGPNGIALDEERGFLYISQYGLDVVRVELETRAVMTMQQPDGIALYGVDGLYLHDGSLVAVQNHTSLNRITRFSLSEDGRRITDAEILVRRHKLFDEPTTGVIVDDGFCFIGNSQIETFVGSEDRSKVKLQPVRILRTKL